VRLLYAGPAPAPQPKDEIWANIKSIKTGDELEGLADQFNDMANRLQESYSGLERKVELRTRELSEALEQQTASSDILRVISGSPTNVQPVFDSIVVSAVRLCGGAWVRSSSSMESW
jgi:nitrate/nitrite-specific signal transduction histidine kinase